MHIAKSLIDGNLSLDSSVSDLLYTCPVCLACDDSCDVIPCSEPYLRHSDIIRLMRHETLKHDAVPVRVVDYIENQLNRREDYRVHHILGKLGLPEKGYDEKAKKVLFLEWPFLNEQEGIRLAVANLVTKIGEPISFSSAGSANLADLFDLGFWEKLEEQISRDVHIESLVGREVVFLNPHTQEFFTKRFPKMGYGEEKINGKHFSEILLEALKSGHLKSKTGLRPVRVSYHDPCYLGRGLKIYEAPRGVLSMLEGVELVEMRRNRRNSLCCGARGGDFYFREFTKITALERMNEFSETGSDFLITACPNCKNIFQTVMGEQRHFVKDIVEFVDERTI